MSSTRSASDPPRWATAFAPASVANVAVGFDILGFSVGALGDRVTVSRTETQGVTITDITGLAGKLPMDPEENTAGRALLAMQLAKDAHGVLEAMRRDFAAASVSIDEWLVDISGDGASVIESG